MRMVIGKVLLCITVFGLSTPVFCQESWIWSRDDNSRPINLTTDSISMMLLESRVPSGDNFIAKDSQVGLLVDTTFEGSSADDPQASRDFPFMFAETADTLNDPTHPHSKILADQEPLIDFFPLTDGKTVYRSISIKVTLLRKQNPAVWAKVFDTLLAATKDVSLPSPLTVGVNYLNKFSTDVLQQYLPNPDAQKSIDLGTFSFFISTDPQKLNRVTQTGLHLRILPSSNTGGGWIDPSNWDQYCFYTKMNYSNWLVYVAPKDPNAPDKDAYGCPVSKYTPLMNDYVPILIEAEQTPKPASALLGRMQEYGLGTGGTALTNFRKRADDLRSAALAECKAFKISDSKCPALRSTQ
jgi:hypothetical protein